MSESQSSRTASIWTNSFHDLNVPLISFVGRPGDSRKGLQLFLDAIASLATTESVPHFGVWIVGGSPIETPIVNRLVAAREPLRYLRDSGRVLIWGWVETASLPDIYARSFIVVIPSRREEFGLVALEAMACGTPVIATNVGGLADIVVAGHTGTLLATHDTLLLTNALAGYLRNPERRHYQGEQAAAWVRLGFDLEHCYSSYIDAYADTTDSLPTRFPKRASVFANKLSRLSPALEQLLDQHVEEIIDCNTSEHVACKVITREGRHFAKQFSLDPARSPTVLPLPPVLRPTRTACELATRYKLTRDCSAVPRLKAVSADAMLVVTEWCEPATNSSAAKERAAIRRITAALRDCHPPPSGEILNQYNGALERALHDRDLPAIEAFDIAAAALNRDVTGGILRFAQVHPGVELLRYRALLARRIWVLPEPFRLRAATVIEHALSQISGLTAAPLLSHGSLRGRHLLMSARHEVVACDLDRCHFAAGPFDEAHYALDRLETHSTGPKAAITELRDLVADGDALKMALGWLIAQLLFWALFSLAQGRPDPLNIFMAFSDAYLSESFLLRDDESPDAAAETLAVNT